ncbi:MAG: hypothetical protein AB2661_19420, partial [Candidatus Thiodiazotropha sp.]
MAMEWAAADFGFRSCPIFQIDILAVEEEYVALGPLRCYTEDPDSKTILAARKRPTHLHPNGPDLFSLLPPSTKVEWVWRTKNSHAVGVEKSCYRIEEIPETRNWILRLQEIQDAASAEGWKNTAWMRLGEE